MENGCHITDNGLPQVKHYHDRIDQLDAEIINNHKSIEIPIRHIFSKGMYVREMSAPKDTLITSKIHKTEHPFTLSKGKMLVLQEDGEWIELEAPFTGITKPGTRRVAVVVEDCIWTTYHPYSTITGKENSLSETDQLKVVNKIENRIIQKRTNKYLKSNKNKSLWHG